MNSRKPLLAVLALALAACTPQLTLQPRIAAAVVLDMHLRAKLGKAACETEACLNAVGPVLDGTTAYQQHPSVALAHCIAQAYVAAEPYLPTSPAATALAATLVPGCNPHSPQTLVEASTPTGPADSPFTAYPAE